MLNKLSPYRKIHQVNDYMVFLLLNNTVFKISLLLAFALGHPSVHFLFFFLYTTRRKIYEIVQTHFKYGPELSGSTGY